MGKKGRKFIDPKKDAVHTFRVVARSQQDPLVADETAPQSVLLPCEKKEKMMEYGIYFDDDYDYLQHLKGVHEAINWDDVDLDVYTIQDPQANKKDTKNKKKLMLPSSVFESYVEEPIGMLNKAAPFTGPRPELDPDIVEALDDANEDACDPDDPNGLPDDFVVMLNSETPVHSLDSNLEDENERWPHPMLDECALPLIAGNKDQNAICFISQREEHSEEHDFSSDFNDPDDSESRDELGSLYSGEFSFHDEETKTCFTNYSLSSSALFRNDKLTQLDDQFEAKFIREYPDELVGALDGEDIDGYVDEQSEIFKQTLEQSRKAMSKERSSEDTTWIVHWIKDMQKVWECESLNEGTEEIEVLDSDNENERWDCQSILSTYSTLYNNPRTITGPPRRKRIATDPRTSVTENGGSRSLTKKALTLHNMDNTKSDCDMETDTLVSSISAISFRPKDESSQERRLRKKAIKELRRERRIERKTNQLAFKMEKLRQEKMRMNNQANQKVPLF